MPGDHFLQIARMTIALHCEDASISWQWAPAVERFLIPPAPPEIDITVRAADSIPPSDGELLFDSGAVWRLFRRLDDYIIECHSPEFESPYKIARFNDSFTHGEIILRSSILPWHLGPLEYPLDEIIVASLLGKKRGIELHSCGVVDHRGRGHLFVGMSGAGKTTTARLWGPAAATIVSDDRVIVREEDGVMTMHGTPWHGEGELSSPASAPVVGIYLLEQSAVNAVREIPRASAVARLFGCSFPPFYDSDAIDFTLEFLERIVEKVPVRELQFTRDANVVDLISAEAA